MSTDVHGGFGATVSRGFGTDVPGGLSGGLGALFSWSVSTPEGVAASGECEFLVVPTTGGELGVLAGHAALVAGVLPGDLRVTAAGGVTMVSVGAGVVEVRNNTVRLLVARIGSPVAGHDGDPGSASPA